MGKEALVTQLKGNILAFTWRYTKTSVKVIRVPVKT
jgi:hypothetical protein